MGNQSTYILWFLLFTIGRWGKSGDDHQPLSIAAGMNGSREIHMQWPPFVLSQNRPPVKAGGQLLSQMELTRVQVLSSRRPWLHRWPMYVPI